MKKWILGSLIGLLVICFGVGTLFAAPIKIGFFAPLTGFAAADGASAKNAVMLAVDKVNKSGGINGNPVKLIVYDDRVNPKESVAIANKLIEKDKVVAVVSGSYSTPTRVTAPIFNKAGIPMVAAYAVDPSITKAGPYIFRTGFLGQVEGKAAGEVAVNLLKAKKLAMFTIDNDFGRALSKGFHERVKKFGGKVVYEHAFAIGTKDFSAMLTKVKELSPDLLFISGYYEEAALAVKQARDLGITCKILGEEGFDSPKFLELAGEAAEGVIITTNLNRDDPRPFVQEFIKSYKAKYGMEPDMVGASSYDAFMVVVNALRKAGPNSKKIRDAIAATKDFNGLTGQIAHFNKLGEAMKPVQVQIVKNGAFHYFAQISDPEIVTPPNK
ncbi:MAG: ABC transporter substrate-binding protein [Deltaproteobacteria bacterium]|nr:MAG: ABC transporter substrate-binding protein [Deltaproteobacteria bacterium]